MIAGHICILLTAFIMHSENGQYIADLSYDDGHDLLDATFTLSDEHGTVLYTRRALAAQTFFISNFGTVFAVDENTLYHYSECGDESVLKTLEYGNGFSFSPDNGLFFASDRAGIFVYSYSGSLVYELPPGRLVASTDQGEVIAVVSTDTLSVYNEGVFQTAIKLPTPYIHVLEFIDDGSRLKVITISKTLFFTLDFDPENGK